MEIWIRLEDQNSLLFLTHSGVFTIDALLWRIDTKNGVPHKLLQFLAQKLLAVKLAQEFKLGVNDKTFSQCVRFTN